MVIGLDIGLDERLGTAFLSRQSNKANVSVNELQELVQDLWSRCVRRPDVAAWQAWRRSDRSGWDRSGRVLV